MKGPCPWTVPQIEIPDTNSRHRVAPHWSNRNVAQTRRGTIRYTKVLVTIPHGLHPPKTNNPTPSKSPSRKPASAMNQGFQVNRKNLLQTKTSGVTIRTPTASPSHHVHQSKPYLAHGMKPAAS